MAAALLSAGRPEDALAALAELKGAPADVLRSHAELLKGDFARALLHAQHALGACEDQTEKLMARSARASARGHLGQAIEPFDVRDIVGIQPEFLEEVVLGIAAAHIAAGEAAAAERWLAFTEPLEPHALARCLMLKARIAEFRLALGDQARIAADVIDHVQARIHEEAALFRSAARMYAILARDLPLGDRIKSLAASEAIFDASTRFEVLRSQARVCALSGEYEAALLALMRATAHACTPLQHIAAYVDLASIAIANGDEHSPFVHAAVATVAHSCRSIEWQSVSDEDALLLPQIAQVFAEAQYHDLARSHFTMAVQVRPARITWAKRYEALLRETETSICAHSDQHAAIRAAREAYELLDELGYVWRAGRLALLMHQRTGLREWEPLANEKLRHYPKSRFYRLLDRGSSKRLTRRQQQVLDGALHGKSPAQIAAHLGIAEETVRKHLGPVLQHFGAKTRLELVARIHQRKDHVATFQRSEAIGSEAKP